MRKISYKLLLLLFVIMPALLRAGTIDSASVAEAELAQYMTYLDSIDKSMPYKTGTVTLREFASFKVPEGYKFIPEKEAQWVVEKLWGNPSRPDVLGMLVTSSYTFAGPDTWAFVVSYDESGYVKDEDADDINYDDMLKDMQKSEAESNKERVAGGYSTIHLMNWASKPYYDKENKVLHWAQELQFGGEDAPTLNYDVRILGRKGVLSMNAVGGMGDLADIKKHIPEILHAATFSDGYQYKDFDPSIDKVAAYSIGGLVAGKLLVKAGIIALLLKNIKLVLLGILAIFGGLRSRIAKLFRRRKKEDEFEPVSYVGLEENISTAEATPALIPVIEPKKEDTAQKDPEASI